MNKLKKLTTTITASFDSIINEFENQDAIIQGAISEIKESKALLSAQMKKLENANYRANEKLTQLQLEISKWEKRVQDSFQTNPGLAHNCSKKIVLIEKEIKLILKEIEANKKSIARIHEEKEKITTKLIEVQSKHRELLSKETQLKANNSVKGMNTSESLNTVIDRWEEKLIRHECSQDHGVLNEGHDPLEEHFLEEELELEIQEKLNELTKQK